MADAQQVDFLIAGLIGNSNSTNYNGIPLAGGKVYYYDVGTTDLKTIYTIADKSVASVNPVILSSEGTAEIFVDGSCDVRIDDADDVTIDTIDGLNYSVTTTSQTVVNVSTNYTAIATNTVILVDSTGDNYTVTLMTAVGIAGEQIVIKKSVAANTVTVDGLSAETIDGLTTRVLYRQHEFIRIMSDGTNWRIIATGVNYYPDGTAALPSIYAEDDTDTGFFFGAGIIGGATGGVEAFRFDSAQIATFVGIKDTTPFVDDGDNSKKLLLELSGITTATTRTLTIPNVSGTIAVGSNAQVFTNKSLTDNNCFFIDDGDASKRLAFQLSGLTISTTRTLTIPDANGTMVLTDESGGLKTKVIDIGDWDIDATGTRAVNHGLVLANIRAVDVTIRNDADNGYYGMSREGTAGTGISINAISSTQVSLIRNNGSFFDGTDFNATSYNRGWITITYTV